MWAYICQNAILSVLSITLVQYLWEYFKTNYTTKKTKHVVEFRTKKYKEMIETITKPPPPPKDDDYITPEEKEKMVEEIMSYIAW